MKLNLGCGTQTPAGWINVDYAVGARLARIPFFRAVNRKLRLFDLDWDHRIYIHDLAGRFPWSDGSADVVYSSHTLEHFTREDGLRFLQECRRVLRGGGVIRLLVPDLALVVKEYREGRLSADRFVEKLDVLYGKRASRLKDKLSPFIQFPHKCMYDAPALLGILHDAGFDAAPKAPFESAIDDIGAVELEDRTRDAVIVEGRKR